ncbi:unnamed protein product, partial [Hapterophycus canaliculatus]
MFFCSVARNDAAKGSARSFEREDVERSMNFAPSAEMGHLDGSILQFAGAQKRLPRSSTKTLLCPSTTRELIWNPSWEGSRAAVPNFCVGAPRRENDSQVTASLLHVAVPRQHLYAFAQDP